MLPATDPLRLGVATPERVALSLPIAGIGSRTGAWLVDAALMFLFWIVAYFLLTLVADVLDLVQGMSSMVAALVLAGVFATQWGYWTAFETLWSGQTPGKRWVGIRVVRLDGAPVGFFESAVRNLLRLVDFLPGLYGAGVVTMLVNPLHRRLGDLAAGTVLIRDEQVSLSRYEDEAIAASPSSSSGAPLPATDAELLLSFFERADAMSPDARARLAQGFLRKLDGRLSDAERMQASAGPAAAERVLRELLARTAQG